MQKIAIGMITTLLVAGCATQAPQERAADPYDTSRLNCSAQIQPEQQVQLDMVDNLMNRERNHAALAQLEAKPMETVDHWVRYGQLQASTGHLDRAETIFQGLVDRCGTGRSHHGLGMVLLKQDEVLKALHHLEIARERTPASAQVRNDYGYVLLMVGDYEDAAYELRTAMELGEGQGPVRQNLAVAYLLTENWGGLEWMKQQYNLTGEERAYAERLAEQFGR
ncbi:MAG TPA: tetratricopeptide repeat protein [Alcanivorax sp.]|jgi:Flp pilus assembly protein TadD|nr:tetratricopeptide repeat protein [Alcanivorax sp.]